MDDDVEEVLALRDTLYQYQTESAHDGLEGLQKAQSFQPDLIISDLKMPKLNGIEFLEQLRRADNPVPFIIITGFSDVKAIRTAWKLGAYDFLDKPFSSEQIRSTTRKALTFGLSARRPSTAHSSVTLSLETILLEALTKECATGNTSIEHHIESILKRHLDSNL